MASSILNFNDFFNYMHWQEIFNNDSVDIATPEGPLQQQSDKENVAPKTAGSIPLWQPQPSDNQNNVQQQSDMENIVQNTTCNNDSAGTTPEASIQQQSDKENSVSNAGNHESSAVNKRPHQKTQLRAPCKHPSCNEVISEDRRKNINLQYHEFVHRDQKRCFLFKSVYRHDRKRPKSGTSRRKWTR